MVEVRMPRLSDSMEEGTVIRWLRSEGDTIACGDEIVEIETDKATVVYESESDGVLHILTEEGESVRIGAPIAMLAQDDDSYLPTVSAASPADHYDAAARGTEQASRAQPVQPCEKTPVSASPIARRTATNLGVDVATIEGSGPRGRVLKRDVIVAAGVQSTQRPDGEHAATEGEKGKVTRVALSRAGRTIARRMSESRATVPDFAVAVEIDMTQSIRLAEHAGRSASVNDVIVQATAKAAVKHPKVNSSYRDGEVELYERVNIGIAVAAPDGLLVPVVKDVPRLDLAELSARTSALITRARDGAISPPDLSGATVTVSNLGMYGATSFRGIINVPQAAILCVGAIEPRAVVGPDGGLLARPVATFTLVCDHRVLYGTDAAEFLSELKLILETTSSQTA